MKKLSLLLAVLLLILAGCSNSKPAATQAPAPDTGTSQPISGTSQPAAADPTPSTEASVPADSSTQKPSPAPTADLTAEEAQAIALRHAGLTADQVTRLHTEPDRERGGLHYDVEFHHDGYEYDYEIDAATGTILSREKDRDD